MSCLADGLNRSFASLRGTEGQLFLQPGPVVQAGDLLSIYGGSAVRTSSKGLGKESQERGLRE